MIFHIFIYINHKFRLQNSRIFCEAVFERKVWSVCRNGDEDWGGMRFTREDYAYGASSLPKREEKTSVLQYKSLLTAPLYNGH